MTPVTKRGSKSLVVVESPAKARTVANILGRQYEVKASVGHVRDLPQLTLGVDVKQGFEPYYIVPKEKRRVVSEIAAAGKKAQVVFLATDPDREGEAIAWHLVQAAGLDEASLKRVVFHEITPQAVREAFRHPRAIDMQLVEAQQARRILDRLVGYNLSPLLWKKVARGLSAGRVQSVALRLVVERLLYLTMLSIVPLFILTDSEQRPQTHTTTKHLRNITCLMIMFLDQICISMYIGHR